MSDILIKNGLIYDGSGDLPFQGDILIEGDKIVEIAPGIEKERRRDHRCHREGGNSRFH